MWKTNKKKAAQTALETAEREAVAGVREALARVIADGNHSDRSSAIDSIQAIDRGWEDEEEQHTVTFRLSKVCTARFDLLGSFSGKTDELPEGASTQMQTALYAIDHLIKILLTRLAAVGMAVYPTMDTPSGEMPELPRIEKDDLLDIVQPDTVD